MLYPWHRRTSSEYVFTFLDQVMVNLMSTFFRLSFLTKYKGYSIDTSYMSLSEDGDQILSINT